MKILSVAWKDLQILMKDRGTLILSFLLPLVFIFAWNLANLARDTASELIAVPVVDLDGSQASQELLARIDGVGGLKTEPYEEARAQELLEAGTIKWLLIIPDDFSTMSADKAVTLHLLLHPDANETEADGVRMAVNGVAQDLALERQLVAGFEQMGTMMESMPPEYQVFTVDTYVAQARSQFEQARVQPLVTIEQITPNVTGEEPVPFTSANVSVPGFTILFCFLTAQVTAQSIFQEKKMGSFRRLLASPLSKAELLTGKMLPNLIVTLLQIVVIFAAAMFLLPLFGLDRLTLGNDPLALVLVAFLVALCSTGLGVFIAALARTESQVGSLSTVALWIMGALGGAFIPTFLMSGALKSISSFVPHSWALRALNELFVYGRGLADVLPEMGVLLAFTAGFFAIGLWRFDFD